MKDFQPKTKRLSKKEKAELLALNLRWCFDCRRVLPIGSFYDSKTVKNCRECSRKCSSRWARENKERYLETLRAWREENSEKHNEDRRKKYAEDLELSRQKSREAYEKNKDRINEKRRVRYYANHEKSREWHNIYEQKQRKNNPLYVLSERVRKRTRYSFKHQKISKNKETQEMLGCSWEELKMHIENQFTEGMSWERIGEIHIDHIIPLASAKTEEDLIKLAHYTNLQPLWAKDNIAKGARVDHLQN